MDNHDPVKSPAHYELVDTEVVILIASCMTPEQWQGYCLGTVMAYRLRAGKKDDLIQDISKSDQTEILYDQYSHLCKPSRCDCADHGNNDSTK